MENWCLLKLYGHLSALWYDIMCHKIGQLQYDFWRASSLFVARVASSEAEQSDAIWSLKQCLGWMSLAEVKINAVTG